MEIAVSLYLLSFRNVRICVANGSLCTTVYRTKLVDHVFIGYCGKYVNWFAFSLYLRILCYGMRYRHILLSIRECTQPLKVRFGYQRAGNVECKLGLCVCFERNVSEEPQSIHKNDGKLNYSLGGRNA